MCIRDSNRGRGQVYPTGDKSNNVVFTSSTSGTINSIETIEDGSYKINIENDNGEISTEAVPVGPQLIVKAQDKINAGDPLTNDPNVGGLDNWMLRLYFRAHIELLD